MLTRFADIVKRMEDGMGSFLITELDLAMPHKPDGRHLSFKIAIRGDDFRPRYEKLRVAIEQEFDDQTSPFASFHLASQRGETGFAGDEVTGKFYDVRIDLKEIYQEGGQQ